jgi:AcrR family transcriptional regulator
MSRNIGSRNADFETAKAALLGRIRKALHGDHPPSSFRSLAKSAGVTIPTLRHYFGGREELFAAVFADCHAGGRTELEIAQAPSGPFRKSIHDLVRHLVDGFRYGRLDRLHAVGLTEGLLDAGVARAYLADILEPTLDAIRQRLEAHIARGEMRSMNARHAALGLASPVLVLFLHQNGLCGAATYPTEIEAFVADHIEAFVKAYELKPNG